MNLITTIKLMVYGIWYPHRCIDNKDLRAKLANSIIEFGHNKNAVNRTPIIANNSREVLDKGGSFTYTNSFIAIAYNATIEPPHGFCYSENGQLICPPNWDIAGLLATFPIKNHIKSNPDIKIDQTIPEAFYLVGPGAYNYYHWITDKVSCLEEYLQYKKNHSPNCKLLVPHGMYPACYEILKSYGIDEADIILWDHDNIMVNKLVISSRNKSNQDHRVNQPERLCQIRTRILNEFQSSNSVQHSRVKKLYVSRLDSTADRQRITNEVALSKSLAERGFEIVSMTGLPFFDQVDLFNGADIIVGLHGAALTNTIFCQGSTQIIEIIPSNLPARYFKDIAEICELQHQTYLVSPNSQDKYVLDIDHFLASMIDN